MKNTNMLVALIVIFAVMAIVFYQYKQVKEDFGNSRYATDNINYEKINVSGDLNEKVFQVPGNYLSKVPQRLGDVSYGNNINYNQYDASLKALDINKQGESELPPVIFDRDIYAVKSSRLKASGDMFRGDIPITPYSTGGWFEANVNPAKDLQVGYYNTSFGNSADTAKKMQNLISKYKN